MKLTFQCLLLLAVLTAPGCISNETSDPRFQTDYKKGVVFVTVVDLQAVVYRGSLPARIQFIDLLSPEDYAKHLKMMEEARQRQRANVFGHVTPELAELSEIPAGTPIRIGQIWLTRDFESGYHMDLNAEFASGMFAGCSVKLERISRTVDVEGQTGFYFYVSDPAYLRKEAPNPEGSVARKPTQDPG